MLKEFITCYKLHFRDFFEFANSIFSKGKSTIRPLFQGADFLFPTSDKTNLLVEIGSEISNLDHSSSFLKKASTLSLNKKLNFLLRISSVKMTKYAEKLRTW